MILDLGGITIEWLGLERFELDAGAMFGPVPRLLWEGKYPVGPSNLSPFYATPLLIRTAGRLIVIDTGLGNRLTAKQMRNFRVTYQQTVPQALCQRSIAPAEIDTVILTHLDWDHAAGIVEQVEPSQAEHEQPNHLSRQRGQLHPATERLRFPKATHVIGSVEWYDANHPNARSTNTYWPENWSLLVQSGRIHFVDGGEEIAPGVSIHLTGGHTRGHMIVQICGEHQTAYHLADIVPTHAHLNPLWVTAYDNFPLQSVEEKTWWLAKVREERAWLLFYHDFVHAAIQLDTDGVVIGTLPRQDLATSQRPISHP